ncbi:MAG: TonB-dependent receptor, partial [Bacteroidaceae bacterium]|nr:TonB-dependent receptor [Bacteroidaceae bacterium]
ENKDRSLPAFSVSNIHLGYTMPIKPLHIKEAVFGIDFNNVFNARYATSGWVYSAICESYGHPNDNRYYELGFVPMAGFTMMGNITLKF